MKKILCLAMAFLLVGHLASAEEAPVPRKSPRTPVNREALPDHKPAIPDSRVLQGQLTVVDSERLRMNDVDLRLFGIVPPQLAASFGPQARATLDNLVANQVITCSIRDRDQAGRFLATCRTGGNADLAIELLRRGLAVTARGSLTSTELAAPYLAAEQAAQAQKLGLWSVLPIAAAPIPDTPFKPIVIQAPPPLPIPEPKAEVKAELRKEEKIVKAAEKNLDDVDAKKPALIAASALAPSSDETYAVPGPGGGFFARYQLLITGFIMLTTALGILLAMFLQRRHEKRDEMKAIAAALRGELMAARAVCQARLKTLSAETDEKNIAWPRIRSTLYQAYVGRLGWLGAELARQVASIYGQSSDYAAYYNTLSGSTETQMSDVTPKRQALQTLMQHIEEVLPKLAVIEQTGRIGFSGGIQFPPPPVRTGIATSRTETIPETTTETPPSDAAPTAVTEVTSSRASTAPLWETMRNFARSRFEKKEEAPQDNEYASLIEEEISGLSFSDGDNEVESFPENVTKIRGTGT